jgi:hypothetical protein
VVETDNDAATVLRSEARRVVRDTVSCGIPSWVGYHDVWGHEPDDACSIGAAVADPAGGDRNLRMRCNSQGLRHRAHSAVSCVTATQTHSRPATCRRCHVMPRRTAFRIPCGKGNRADASNARVRCHLLNARAARWLAGAARTAYLCALTCASTTALPCGEPSRRYVCCPQGPPMRLRRCTSAAPRSRRTSVGAVLSARALPRPRGAKKVHAACRRRHPRLRGGCAGARSMPQTDVAAPYARAAAHSPAAPCARR